MFECLYCFNEVKDDGGICTNCIEEVEVEVEEMTDPDPQTEKLSQTQTPTGRLT